MKLNQAAVLIPSDSILRGEIDISQHLKTFECLTRENIQVKKVSLVQENVNLISSEVQLLGKLFDLVVVLSGPQAQTVVSKALADITSQDATKVVDGIQWPTSVKLIKLPTVGPIIYVQRIFIIAFDTAEEQLNYLVENHLRQYQLNAKYTKVFSVNLNGSKKYLDDVSRNVNVTFDRVNSVLKVTADTFEEIVQGELLLQNVLGRDILSSEWVDESSDLIYLSGDPHIRHSIEVIEKCLKDYGVENVFLSFNGGKDCTVLLHLVLAVLHRNYPKNDRKLFCLYVKSDNAFKEQDEFIEQCMIFYNLQVICVTGNIKDALRITINKRPNLKACFMGTRRTDPYCAHLNSFQMTDPDWPQIMRCSPFLDWLYTDIWDYLLYYKVPYCKLYDYGYTSLGNAVNTIRNPSLRFCEGDKEVYLPAYKMLNEKNERSGRNVSKM